MTTNENALLSCALCATAHVHGITDDENRPFCCPGCRAVYQVLQARAQLKDFKDHYFFKEAVSLGIVSNPTLLDQLHRAQLKKDNSQKEKKKLFFAVVGLWCPSCSEVIRWSLAQVPGVCQCITDYATELCCVEFDARQVSRDEIFHVIRRLGYGIDTFEEGSLKAEQAQLWRRFAITGFCALNAMMFSFAIYAANWDGESVGYSHLFAWLSALSAMPVVTYGCWPIYQRFKAALQTGLFGVETLVVLSVTAATVLSTINLLRGSDKVYFDTASVIVALLLAGKVIGAKVKFSARKTFTKLLRTQPRRARRLSNNGKLQFVPIEEIAKGDLVRVYVGEKMPIDGIVIAGSAALDESPINGEMMPTLKEVGAAVFCGSLVVQGQVDCKVVNEPAQSTLQKIIDVVEADLHNKKSQYTALERAVSWFVPLIVSTAVMAASIALFTHGMDEAVERLLSVLLIACPCAIGIAIPLTEAMVIDQSAKKGAIIRRRQCIDVLGDDNVFIFDKTGTLTDGKFTVVEGLEKLDEDDLSGLSATVQQSIHPIAKAIATSLPMPSIRASEVKEIVGQGLVSKYNDSTYLVGNEELLKNYNVMIEGGVMAQETSSSICYVVKDGALLTKLRLSDRPRAMMKQVVEQLSPSPIAIVSGDSEGAVANVARQLGITDFHFRQSPLQKRDKLMAWQRQGKKVVFIGDGINDAAALTAANCSITTLGASDFALQLCDIALTTPSLELVPQLCALCREGRKIRRQNLFWTFAYNVAGIGLAVIGWLTPLLSASAMVVSSLLVLCNAQRLTWYGCGDSQVRHK